MVHEPIYLDLSSSDEDDDDHNRGSTALLYLAKLEMVAVNGRFDLQTGCRLANLKSSVHCHQVFHMEADDDDVKIIDKPPSNNGNEVTKRVKPKLVRTTTLDDDDCCILDTDPGAEDSAPDVVSSLNTDELVMTGEKGPVACRDFPHARYLCVHFPFKSTLHSKFCAQCHCYVCDSLAPCSHWGEGNGPDDHCNASEEPRWKSLRKIAKYGSVHSLGGAPATGAAADPNGGGNRLVQATLIHKLPPPPIPSPSPSPAEAAAAPTVTKLAPLTIHLKGRGRGKISEGLRPGQRPRQPARMGVRNPQPARMGVRHQKANLGKSAAECLVPPFPSPPDVASLATVALPSNPNPNPTTNPNFRLGRVGDGAPTTTTTTTTTTTMTISATITATITPPLSTMQSVNVLPYRGAGAGARAGGGAVAASSPLHTRSRNTRPKRAGGVVVVTQQMLNPDAAPSNPSISAPPLNPSVSAPPSNPNFSAPPLNPSVSAPPSNPNFSAPLQNLTVSAPPFNPSISAPPHNPSVSAAPLNPIFSAATFLPPHPPVPSSVLNIPIPSISDRTHPSAATPPRDPWRENQHIVSDDKRMEDYPNTSQPQPRPGSDFAAPMDSDDHTNASSSGATVDIVAGPIEGWEMKDSFADAIGRDDAIEQMGVGDYLWEPYTENWQ